MWVPGTSETSRVRRALLLLAPVVVLATLAPAARADTPAGRAAADDSGTADDLRARSLFAAGDYQAARDLYAQLYAKTMHPTYLRNIGRCYQNLGEPDRAISAFREYLRQAKDLAPAARADVERYIAEMEAVERERRARTNAPPAAPPPPTAAPALELSRPAPTPRDTSPGARPSLARRWWFWAGVGALSALATATVYWWPSASAPGAAPSRQTDLGTRGGQP